jgi:ketosteroid isomerase-like protein
VLASFHQAMIDVSADDLADLYAVDGVHEFPFLSPGFPARYTGREEVRAGYRARWADHPVKLNEVRTVFVYQTTDPEVIVCAAELDGTLNATGQPFGASGLLTLQVRDGLITHCRDYMDSLGICHSLGVLAEVVASLDAQAVGISATGK